MSNVTSPDLSGFDLGPTLEIYRANEGRILARVDGRVHAAQGPGYPLVSTCEGHPMACPSPFVKALKLFPESVWPRTCSVELVVNPWPHWFASDSTASAPRPTLKAGEALSPTALIPSMITYQPGESFRGRIRANITMFSLPPATSEAGQIVMFQAFVHEVVHALLAPVLYGDAILIRIGDTERDSFEVLLELANLIEGLPPISRYASAYMTSDHRFAGEGDAAAQLRAISEVLTEHFAAFLVGFAARPDGHDPLDAFFDRPEVAEKLRLFLEAELVT